MDGKLWQREESGMNKDSRPEGDGWTGEQAQGQLVRRRKKKLKEGKKRGGGGM